MELVKGVTTIEVILQNDKEYDSLKGIYNGWNETNYIAIRREDGNLTYISEKVIKVIHIIEGTNGR